MTLSGQRLTKSWFESTTLPAKIELVIHWSGGVHTRLLVSKNRYGQNKNAASEQTVEMVRELARGWSDRYIAQILNRIGSRTGPGNSWSETRVKTFRNQHQIPVFSAGVGTTASA